jgi:DNA polymerase-3 subunit epsilon
MHGNPDWATGELLGFDLETTGVDRFSDRPVSYALVTLVHGEVTDRRSGLVDPGIEVPAGATAVHGITTERARAEGRPLPDALVYLADALEEAVGRGVPVVGMKLDYDLTMLDVQCRMVTGRGLIERGFAGPVLDALVLDRHADRFRRGRRTLVDLCAYYGVTIDHAHDAAADAQAAARVVLELCRRHPDLCEQDLSVLHRSQSGWHREWAESYDQWRSERGMTPLDPREFQWPIPGDAVAHSS